MKQSTDVYGEITEDNLNKARFHYSTAFLLFYQLENHYYQYQVVNLDAVIQLLDAALLLVPDFIDAYYLREEVWHEYLISTKGTDLQETTYNLYLNSEAWKQKCQQVSKRDDGKCVLCGKSGDEVHHNTYERIGKEKLSDLSCICKPCHADYHSKKEVSGYLPRTISHIASKKFSDQELTDIKGKADIFDNVITYDDLSKEEKIKVAAMSPEKRIEYLEALGIEIKEDIDF